jgi:hypothetical protein
MALPVTAPDFHRYYMVEMDDVTLAQTAYVACGGRGRVVAVYTVLHGAVATTDAVLTPKINGTAMAAGGQKITAAAVAAAGSGYAVGDRMQIVGGDGTPAIVTVATLDGTGVATVTMASEGDYVRLPPTTASVVPIASCAGTGATFTHTDGSADATITVTAASSAAGNVDSCRPSRLNDVNVGDTLQLTSDGGPDDTPARLTAVFVVREAN